jgi:hypothetical protein
VAGFCEDDNDPPCTIKSMVFFDIMSHSQLLKSYPAP